MLMFTFTTLIVSLIRLCVSLQLTHSSEPFASPHDQHGLPTASPRLTMILARAEDRAPWRHDPSAVPGAKTEGGRHDAALFHPSGLAPRRQIGLIESKVASLPFTLSMDTPG
jgi:hypothetical protein